MEPDNVVDSPIVTVPPFGALALLLEPDVLPCAEAELFVLLVPELELHAPTAVSAAMTPIIKNLDRMFDLFYR